MCRSWTVKSHLLKMAVKEKFWTRNLFAVKRWCATVLQQIYSSVFLANIWETRTYWVIHFFHLFLAECRDAHERHCWLANPRYPKRYQPADAQGEDSVSRAVHEGRAGPELCSWQQHPNRWKGELRQTQQQQQSGSPTRSAAHQQHQKLLILVAAAIYFVCLCYHIKAC